MTLKSSCDFKIRDNLIPDCTSSDCTEYSTVEVDNNYKRYHNSDCYLKVLMIDLNDLRMNFLNNTSYKSTPDYREGYLKTSN